MFWAGHSLDVLLGDGMAWRNRFPDRVPIGRELPASMQLVIVSCPRLLGDLLPDSRVAWAPQSQPDSGSSSVLAAIGMLDRSGSGRSHAQAGDQVQHVPEIL
jgi:hypothetical protein